MMSEKEKKAIDLASRIAFARQQKNDSALAQQYERAAKHRATELEFMDELKRLTDGEPAE
jgi:hypothetical protein